MFTCSPPCATLTHAHTNPCPRTPHGVRARIRIGPDPDTDHVRPDTPWCPCACPLRPDLDTDHVRPDTQTMSDRGVCAHSGHGPNPNNLVLGS